MSRLESIKERASKIGGTPWKATDYSNDYYCQGYAVQSWNSATVAKCIEEAGEVDFIANAPTDIAYLLSKLEIAQKALDEIYNVESLCERDSLLYAITEINQIAEKALDQLKEG